MTTILSCRGTGSLFDVVTDVQAMPGMLNGKDNRSGLEEGFPDEFTAHTGMLEAAKRIYKLLVADEQPSLRHEHYFVKVSNVSLFELTR